MHERLRLHDYVLWRKVIEVSEESTNVDADSLAETGEGTKGVGSLEPAAFIREWDDGSATFVRPEDIEILWGTDKPLLTADQFVELIERRIQDLQKEDDSVNEMLGDAMSEEDHEKMDALCKEHNRLMTKVTTLKRLRSEFTQNGDME